MNALSQTPPPAEPPDRPPQAACCPLLFAWVISISSPRGGRDVPCPAEAALRSELARPCLLRDNGGVGRLRGAAVSLKWCDTFALRPSEVHLHELSTKQRLWRRALILIAFAWLGGDVLEADVTCVYAPYSRCLF